MSIEFIWSKARKVKWPKLTYCIKIRRELSRRKSLKARLRKLGCLVKDSFYGGPSRISSPVGHSSAYEMFVMDNIKKIFIHRFPIFRISYFSKG